MAAFGQILLPKIVKTMKLSKIRPTAIGQMPKNFAIDTPNINTWNYKQVITNTHWIPGLQPTRSGWMFTIKRTYMLRCNYL